MKKLRNRAKAAQYAREHRREHPEVAEKHRERTRRWRLNNPDKYAEQKKRFRKRYQSDPAMRIRQANYNHKKFGLSMDRFFEMLAEQSGKCRLCGEAFGQEIARKPVPDHCHETGKVRGMLCELCNKRMWTVDNKHWLSRAFRYKKGILEEQLILGADDELA